MTRSSSFENVNVMWRRVHQNKHMLHCSLQKSTIFVYLKEWQSTLWLHASSNGNKYIFTLQDWNWTDIGKWVREVSLSVNSLSQLCAVIGKGKRVISLSSLWCCCLLPPVWFDLFVFCDLLNLICWTVYWLLFYLFGLFVGLSGLLAIVLIVICKFVLFIYWLDHNLCLSSFLIFCNWWWTIAWLYHNSCKFYL